LVTDRQIVLAAQSAEGEDFSSGCGLSIAEFAASHYSKGRELIFIDRKLADSKLIESLTLSNCHEQAEYLRGAQAQRIPSAPIHFALAGLQTWWAKVLPSSYGFFIRLENPAGEVGAANRELFVLIRRGKLALFHVPDLSSLGAERSRDMALSVKYLAEKHAVPVQGFLASSADWLQWSESGSNAWKKIALAIQSNDAQLVPFRWQIMTLVATRAIFGL
jgi:hypothetical protein